MQEQADQKTTDIQNEYAHINRLKFSPHFENVFQIDRKESFLQINHTLLLICCVIYISFVFTDLAIVPAGYVEYIILARLFIALLMFTGFYLIKYAQNKWVRQHVFLVLAVLIFLVALHISASSYFLPRPLSEVYILGMVQLYITVPAILKPHSKICLLTMLSMLVLTACTLFLMDKPPLLTNSSVINEILKNFPVSYTLFLSGLILLSAYLAYAYEKMLRKNWLDNQLTKIKSYNLTQLSKKLKTLSHKDELTQLANRRSFQQTLNTELQDLHRSAKPFSLLMLDVDNFKAYNDIYGHQAGDDCLRKVAQCLDATCQRSADMPARYGGEEFMVILPNTDSQAAYYLAEKIRTAIETLNIPHTGTEAKKVTVSIGLTTVFSSHEINIDNLIKQADDALYAAKAKGRNCTEVYAV